MQQSVDKQPDATQVRWDVVNHWFKHRGFNALDLYDVMVKLCFIHNVDANWHVMPYATNSHFPEAFYQNLGQSLAMGKNFLIVPLGTETHWTVALIDHRARTIEYWDSRGRRHSFRHPWIRFRLDVMAYALRHFGRYHYQTKNVVSIRHQHSDTNCGLYVIRFMEQKMRGIATQPVVRDFSYDMESVKSRYHHIRCTTPALLLTDRRRYRKDNFCSVPQSARTPWLAQVWLACSAFALDWLSLLPPMGRSKRW